MKLLQNGTIAKRLTLAKTLGLLIGIIGFVALPYVWPEATLQLRIGVLLWYLTLGGMVGIMGLIDHHPLWKDIKLPAWFRGLFLGAWLNFVLVFFAYDQMASMLVQLDLAGMTTPWWFVLEGAIIGVIIDLIATKHGGEGKGIL